MRFARQLASALLLGSAAVVSSSVVPLWAQSSAPQASVAEQYLFNTANAERTQRGIPPLRWDNTLYRAASYHADQMASRGTISHQFPGEPELSARGASVGAHFSVIAENVAMAPNAAEIHTLWMNSPHHRENLLDPKVDTVAIRVVRRNGEFYAVQDFEKAVVSLSFFDQEKQISILIQDKANITILPPSDEARRTCSMDTGYAGPRKPWYVMRFTAGDLSRLPDPLLSKLESGKFHVAAIGACPATDTQNFSAYNIAVLLYP